MRIFLVHRLAVVLAFPAADFVNEHPPGPLSWSDSRLTRLRPGQDHCLAVWSGRKRNPSPKKSVLRDIANHSDVPKKSKNVPCVIRVLKKRSPLVFGCRKETCYSSVRVEPQLHLRVFGRPGPRFGFISFKPCIRGPNAKRTGFPDRIRFGLLSSLRNHFPPLLHYSATT